MAERIQWALRSTDGRYWIADDARRNMCPGDVVVWRTVTEFGPWQSEEAAERRTT